MQVAILFWVYKDVALCVSRARHLRAMNPGADVHVLFGGDLEKADTFRTALRPWTDDFYVFSEQRSAEWKWRHGDLVVASWFREHGSALPWDSILLAQWDLLMIDRADRILSGLQADQLVLPGLRPISEVEAWWWWVRRNSPERSEYERFVAGARETGELPDDPMCCQFITAVLPRAFLARYASRLEPEIGFLEYKVPMLAQAWGFGFYRSRFFRTIWREERPGIALGQGRWNRFVHTFHAEKEPVSKRAVAIHAHLPFGRRVFHPFTEPYPTPVDQS